MRQEVELTLEDGTVYGTFSYEKKLDISDDNMFNNVKIGSITVLYGYDLIPTKIPTYTIPICKANSKHFNDELLGFREQLKKKLETCVYYSAKFVFTTFEDLQVGYMCGTASYDVDHANQVLSYTENWTHGEFLEKCGDDSIQMYAPRSNWGMVIRYPSTSCDKYSSKRYVLFEAIGFITGLDKKDYELKWHIATNIFTLSSPTSKKGRLIGKRGRTIMKIEHVAKYLNVKIILR